MKAHAYHIPCVPFNFVDHDPRVSRLVWFVMFISLATIVALPKPSGFRIFIIATVLQMILSVGVIPTLRVLGVIKVSRILKLCASYLLKTNHGYT